MTAPTLASLSAYLSAQCGPALAAAGLDGSAASAAFLNPITSSAAALGLALGDPMGATDADLAFVTAGQVPQLRDVAEYLTLRLALQSYLKYDQSMSMNDKKMSQVADRLKDQLDAMAAELLARYGYGLRADAFAASSPAPDDPCWRVPDDQGWEVRRRRRNPGVGPAPACDPYPGGHFP